MPAEAIDKQSQLQQLPMFEHVDDSSLEPLAKYFIPETFEADQYVFREGQPAEKFTFITDGKVKVKKTKSSGREVTLGVFQDGEAVGHVAVFEEIEYPASAVALEDTVILSIYRNHFLKRLLSNQTLLSELLESMMRRNHHLVQRINEVTTDGVETRLALLFQKLAQRFGVRRKADDGSMNVVVEVDLSRQDLADLVNTRVETAIRIMSSWNKEGGPVVTEKQSFRITDQERLDEIAPDACRRCLF
jgi:CRP/FNR family transcriptional regulator